MGYGKKSIVFSIIIFQAFYVPVFATEPPKLPKALNDLIKASKEINFDKIEEGEVEVVIEAKKNVDGRELQVIFEKLDPQVQKTILKLDPEDQVRFITLLKRKEVVEASGSIEEKKAYEKDLENLRKSLPPEYLSILYIAALFGVAGKNIQYAGKFATNPYTIIAAEGLVAVNAAGELGKQIATNIVQKQLEESRDKNYIKFQRLSICQAKKQFKSCEQLYPDLTLKDSDDFTKELKDLNEKIKRQDKEIAAYFMNNNKPCSKDRYMNNEGILRYGYMNPFLDMKDTISNTISNFFK